jgi:hypothetical protein
MIIYKSTRKKGYKAVGSGPGKIYPRITFARELSEYIVGKSYTVILDDLGKLVLLPMVSEKKKK